MDPKLLDLPSFFSSLNDAVPMILEAESFILTDLYFLHSGNRAAGGTQLGRAWKATVPDPATAFVRLCARFLEDSSLLPSQSAEMTGDRLYHLLRAEQVLPAGTGTLSDIASVRFFYDALLAEVTASADPDIVLNGIEASDLPALHGGDFQQAVTYCDAWNEKLFYIETADAWWLLSWMTDV